MGLLHLDGAALPAGRPVMAVLDSDRHLRAPRPGLLLSADQGSSAELKIDPLRHRHEPSSAGGGGSPPGL
jgi:hypothetical protein